MIVFDRLLLPRCSRSSRSVSARGTLSRRGARALEREPNRDGTNDEDGRDERRVTDASTLPPLPPPPRASTVFFLSVREDRWTRSKYPPPATP